MKCRFSEGDFCYHPKLGKTFVSMIVWDDSRYTYLCYTGHGPAYDDLELLTESEYLWAHELHRYFGLEGIL